MLPVNAFVKIGILYHIPFAIANKNLKKLVFRDRVCHVHVI